MTSCGFTCLDEPSWPHPAMMEEPLAARQRTCIPPCTNQPANLAVSPGVGALLNGRVPGLYGMRFKSVRPSPLQ